MAVVIVTILVVLVPVPVVVVEVVVVVVDVLVVNGTYGHGLACRLRQCVGSLFDLVSCLVSIAVTLHRAGGKICL